MRILKTMLPDEKGISLCDSIEYEGHIWLVPEWLDDTPTVGFSRPARIVRVTGFAQPCTFGGADYLISNPLPKGVLDGHVLPELETLYVVIKNPNITVETPPVLH